MLSFFSSDSKSRNLLSFGYFALLTLWATLYVSIIGRTMLANALLYSSDRGIVSINDFVNLYMAGTMGLKAVPQHIYDPLYQLACSNNLIAPVHLDKTFLCPYPPIDFLLLAPLSVLPMRPAFVAWLIFSCAFFVACIAKVVKQEARLTRKDLIWLLVGTFASLPSDAALYLGEVSWIMTGLVLLYYLAFVKKADVTAGMLLALTVAKPTYTPFLCLPSLAWGRWKLLLVAAITETVLFAISLTVFGWDNLSTYVNVLLNGHKNPLFWGHNPERMASMRGVLTIVNAEHAMSINLCLMLLAMIWVFFQWRTIRTNVGASDSADKHEAVRWAMALTVVASLVFNPHEHLHDCLPMVLPALLTLNTLSFFEVRSITPISLRIWHVCILLYPLLSIALFLFWEFYPPLHLYAFPFLVLHVVLLIAGNIYWLNNVRNRAQNTVAS